MGAPVLIVHDTDPADEIRDEVGSFCEGVTMLGADVLLVMYERIKSRAGEEKKSKGGIILVETQTGTSSEDKWQGKVGLVMKMGPIAFQDDESHRFGGIAPKVGDWVIVNVNETYSFDMPVFAKGQHGNTSPTGARRGRIVQDIYIKGIVSPEIFNAIW